MYRVKFNLIAGPFYYTEWFETLEEAHEFMSLAIKSGGIRVHQIEHENGEEAR